VPPVYPTSFPTDDIKTIFTDTYKQLTNELIEMMPEDLPEETRDWVQGKKWKFEDLILILCVFFRDDGLQCYGREDE